MKPKHLSILALGFTACLPLLAQVSFNQNPSRVLGQSSLIGSARNLVEGREFSNPQGVALDLSVSPPIVYVADAGNNRVLAWRDANSFANGAKASLVIGQKDLVSTAPLGPGTSLNSGLSTPSSVAVDNQGNLFVADAGNNRVLRYPKPFEQPEAVKLADIALGQPNLTSRLRNRGQGAPSSNTITTNLDDSPNCSRCLTTSLAFDAQGNLWFTDSGNSRVLRYSASVVRGSASGGDADAVLGQPDFTSVTLPDFSLRTGKTYLRFPGGVAVDSAGNVYVSDDLNRVAYYSGPVIASKQADRILGVVPAGGINDTNVGGNFTGGVRGVFCIGENAFVSDAANNRILRYDPPSQWASESAGAPSPAAKAVIGQDGFTTGAPNRGATLEPGPSGFSFPGVAAVNALNGEVFVVDSGNNRVLAFPDLSNGPPVAGAGTAYTATRVLGQDFFYGRAANLIEGREFDITLEQIPGSYTAPLGANMAVDNSSTPPRLYVADPLNNRVLCFADARKIQTGNKADLVIGQVDFYRNFVNSPTNDASKPNESGLRLPAGVAVDSEGNLWVADRGNSRVLRFPKPFEQEEGLRKADIVIGQSGFGVVNPDPSARTMAAPQGLAFSVDGHLLVSDVALNRVLLFVKPFSTGMSAVRVFGQPDFNTATAGAGQAGLRFPRDLAVDIDDRLYVTDPGNLRVVIYGRLTDAENGPNAAATLPLGWIPSGIDVRRDTREIWIGDASSGRAVRFDSYDAIFTNPNPSAILPVGNVVSLRTDGFNNLLVADYAARIAVRYPVFSVTNSASGFIRVAPAMIATLYLQPAAQAAVSSPVIAPLPWPVTVGDIQVTVGGIPAPIYYVYPRQIAVQIPSSVPVGQNAEVLVARESTGQILAATTVRVEVASPAFFTANQAGTGQIAARNRDGITANSKTAPANRGEFISLYLTGYGNIPGAPADGQPAPGVLSTPDSAQLLVAIGAGAAEVQYSGVAPGYAGLWQINAKIPDSALTCPTPPCDVVVAIRYRDIFSNQNPVTGSRITTTISVK